VAGFNMIGKEKREETGRELTDGEIRLLQEAHPPLKLSPKRREEIFQRLKELIGEIKKQPNG